MMDKSNIGKVKEFFNKLLTPEQKEAFKKEFGEITPITPVVQAETPMTPEAPATPTAGTAKLKDGTVVEYDNLAEGGILMVVGPDGTKLPAPVGEHYLEDGTEIVVTDGGKIVSVKKVEVPTSTPEPVAQNSNDAASKLIDALKGLMESKFAEQAKEIEALKDENKSLKESFSKYSENLNTVSEFFNAIMETPTKNEVPVIKTSKKQTPLTYL